MKYDAILFDLDGTLLDTAPDMANAANLVLAEYNLSALNQQQIQANTSYGVRGLLRAGFGERITKLDFTALRQSFLFHYENDICRGTTMYTGIAELIDKLETLAIPWGIVTNKPQFLTEMLLPYFPLLQKAQTVVSGDTFEKAKPHPLPLLNAAKALNTSQSQCVYVGDIENDIIAANAAGMFSGVASWGYIGEEHQPAEWDADRIFHNPQDVLSMFRS